MAEENTTANTGLIAIQATSSSPGLGSTGGQEQLSISPPPPPPGYNSAKITIFNQYGTSNTIVYNYKNVCVPTPPPPPDYNPNLDSDIANAYEDCLSGIDELFCDPIPSGIPLELTGETFDPLLDTIVHNGSEINYRFNFRGYGSYRIAANTATTGKLRLERGVDILSITGSISSLRGVEVAGKIQIPLDINKDYDVLQINVYLLSEGDERSSIIPFKYVLKVQPVADEVGEREALRVLSADRDLTDSNKETYIMSDLVADINKTKGTFGTRPLPTFIEKDPYRNRYRSFWIKESPDIEKLFFALTASLEVATSELYYNQNYFLSEKITQNNKPVRDDDLVVVLDMVYDHLKPYTAKEVSEKNLAQNTITYEVLPEYNFYHKNYEELVADPDIKERILPNMYYHQLLDQQRKDLGLRKRRGDRISEVDPKISELVNLGSEEQIVDYYDHFVENYNNSTILSQSLNASKNVVIPYSFLSSIDKFSKKDEIFPIHIDIKFDTNTDAGFKTVEGDKFSNLLKNNIIGNLLFLDVVNKFSKDGEVTETEFIKQEDAEGTEITKNVLRHIDIIESLDEISTDMDDNNFIFLGDYGELRATKSSPIEFLMKKNEFIQEIGPLIKRRARNYKDIFSGKKCYKETLFYRIQKVRGDQFPESAEAENIQNIWMPNDPDKPYLRYIDSQVKYDQKYTYRIYSYDLVLANQYAYNNDNAVINEQKLIVVENIYKEFSSKVKDRPPVAPEISLYPYVGIDNKLLIMLNKGTATYKQKEVILNEDDREFFEDVRFSQNLTENEMIEFSGDDTIKKYQIFRTTNAPKKYEDFSNSLLIEVDTRTDPLELDSYADSTSYTDNIRPNTKYYYMFRCTDIHDQISNPSLVYEIEMVNEHGTVFPLISVYDFPKEEKREKTRNIKRFLMIKPSDLQGYMQINTDGTEENYTSLLNNGKITFGLEETSVFNKKYKLRLVSKNSNKVYDLNFSFANEVKIKE